jgi:flagellar biosynthesis protein FlhF
VFIGPPGSGKTTVLCKWLTMAVLTEERAARVSRLDAASSNTAEFLSVHCEMLGVPLDRSAHEPPWNSGLHFVDLPGIASGDDRAVASLREQLSGLHAPAVHLVLNAAYETEMLLAQSSAFAPFGPVDLVLTHFDEEVRRVKLWNLVFGTNFTIRFVSAGQKIPGEFRAPVPDDFFPCEINQ